MSDMNLLPNSVTCTWVIEQVAEVRRLAGIGDYEAAHLLEDTIHLTVLRAIANRDHRADADALAYEAMRSSLIEFPRPCA